MKDDVNIYYGKWYCSDEAMPNKTAWYIVYAPDYIPGKHGTKEKINGGIMFAKYTMPDNTRKGGWSIEKEERNIGCVKLWKMLDKLPKGVK